MSWRLGYVIIVNIIIKVKIVNLSDAIIILVLNIINMVQLIDFTK